MSGSTGSTMSTGHDTSSASSTSSTTSTGETTTTETSSSSGDEPMDTTGGDTTGGVSSTGETSTTSGSSTMEPGSGSSSSSDTGDASEGEESSESSTTGEPSSDMVEIPAGPFTMGSEDLENEQPVRIVSLDTYWIDRTEVTVAAYRACVESGCCEALTPGERCNDGVAGRDDHPITCVSWAQANRYCECQGKALPTEAQWEKAARGTDGRAYPWGDTPAPNCSRAAMNEGGLGCGTSATLPVGSRSPLGDSPYGVQDMAGNAWEWVADYEGTYDPEDLDDPTGPATGSRRVLRGASWTHSDSQRFRTTYRNFTNPALAFDDFGMRCVSDVAS